METANQRPRRQILWVDDEIDLLRSHIIFLADRGYDVTPATNGEDAVALASERSFDIVLLDEMMAGQDGLTTLDEIKSIHPTLPVVMVTKSEEEELMNEAIGKRIDDYLVKPVNPSQIVLACKRLLDARQIREQKLVRDYVSEFSSLHTQISTAGWSEWMDIFGRLAAWDLEIHSYNDPSLSEMHHSQWRHCNQVFARYVEENYAGWVAVPRTGPITSAEVVRQFVVPHIGARPVYFIVIDCMRLDQWLAIEPLIAEYFAVRREHYYATLPTATPFSRNALFAGMFPAGVARRFPDLWTPGNDEDQSLNRFENQLLVENLARVGVKQPIHYQKVLDASDGRAVLKKIGTWKNAGLVALVFNFVDHLSHGRSESEILQEITPDEASFRSLTVSWFSRSALFEILKWISRTDSTVIVTTDHGSVLGTRATIARGNRETSTNLRYKSGTNLQCDPKEALLVRDPLTFGLPRFTPSTNFIIAKEDFYFVYPTRANEFGRHYRNSFQHGGISLEEMILPVVTLTPRR
ncbi:MAG: Alginate biosynthesis transcriptional regulatory protein AlgB [Candidatus Latescibacteria bacterium ADurb.Bin168]|nr:MAG: Alginate biosynthesis transcriptional regulatory protein AlgB [Candidatus Latescibacteria bacterium ADurb.Bin168]